MQRHCENAHKVANFLNNHEMVEKVYWPGLHSHKNHDVAKKQMSGFGGMLSFRIKDFNKEQTIKFLEKLHFPVSLSSKSLHFCEFPTKFHRHLVKNQRNSRNVEKVIVGSAQIHCN